MRLQPGLIGLLACLALTGLSACASAPIDLGASDTREMSGAEYSLQNASETLVRQVENRQWMKASAQSDGTQRMFNQLLGQRQARDADTQDYVARYVAEAGSELDAVMSNDLTTLAGLSQNVAVAAFELAASQDEMTRRTLDANISTIERALNSARRAQGFFQDVKYEANLGNDPDVLAASEGLTAAIALLAEGADALADRRWAIYNQPIG